MSNISEYYKWIDALYTAMDKSIINDDPSNIWKYNGYKQFARKYNQIINEISKNILLPPIFDLFNVDNMRGGMDTTTVEQKDLLMSVFTNVTLLRSVLAEKLDFKSIEMLEIEDFLKSRLRSTFYSKPLNEGEVQDNIERLFVGHGYLKGQDYDREVGRVKVSSKEVIPDFIFQNLSLAIEVKLIKDSSRISSAIDEINADILSYSKKYSKLLFVVYDLGNIRDDVEFRQDIDGLENSRIVIIKH